MPCPLQGAGAISAEGLCPTALAWPCPGPGQCAPGISHRSRCRGGCERLSFSPRIASRQSPASPRPGGLPAGMFVRGLVPGQSVFPGSGRGARGNSESAFQGRSNFRRRSVFRRQPEPVSGEKSSAPRLSFPAWPTSAAPRDHPNPPALRGSEGLCSPYTHRTPLWS